MRLASCLHTPALVPGGAAGWESVTAAQATGSSQAFTMPIVDWLGPRLGSVLCREWTLPLDYPLACLGATGPEKARCLRPLTSRV